MNHRLWFIVHEWWNVKSEAIYYGIPALSICGSYIAYKFLLLPRDRTFLTKVHTIFNGTVQSKRSERTPEFVLGLKKNVFQAKYHQSSLVWFGLFGSIIISLPRFIYSLLLGTSVLEHLRVLPSNQIRIFILPPNRFSNWVKVIITRWILDELILSSPLESLLTQINLITTRVKGPSNLYFKTVLFSNVPNS